LIKEKKNSFFKSSSVEFLFFISMSTVKEVKG